MTKQQSSGKAKGGKGPKAEQVAPAEESRLATGRVFVADKYGGWQVRPRCAPGARGTILSLYQRQCRWCTPGARRTILSL